MKAKMAADKEKLKAEKRHQEVCVLRRFSQSQLFVGSLWSLSRELSLAIQTNSPIYKNGNEAVFQRGGICFPYLSVLLCCQNVSS